MSFRLLALGLTMLMTSFAAQANERSQLVKLSLSLQSKPYVWNTNGPSSFDCSGFVHFVMNKTVGKDRFPLPYHLKDMPGYIYQSVYYRDYLQKARAQVDCKRSKIGDIVFFPKTATEYNHIGIISDAHRLYFVTAQSRQMGVKELPFFAGSYWGSRKPVCYKNVWLR
jgi:cell wall-associated NlpC family hydrolase